MFLLIVCEESTSNQSLLIGRSITKQHPEWSYARTQLVFIFIYPIVVRTVYCRMVWHIVCTPFNVKHNNVLSNNWYREKRNKWSNSDWTNTNQQTLIPSQSYLKAEKSNDLLITIAIGRLKMTSNNPSNPMHMSSVGERVIVT